MLGPQQTYNQVLDLVKQWRPKKAYDHERKFQSGLQEYLDHQLNEGGSGMGDLLAGGDGSQYAVSTERGAARADVVVDDEVGVELKRELSNSQTKKLRGQIESYLDHYDYVIVCACGITDMDGWRELTNKYEGGNLLGSSGGSGLGAGVQEVAFVHKREENYGTNAQSDGTGLLGGSDDGGWL